jgi:hypothetical protein
VPASIYQTVVANMQQQDGGGGVVTMLGGGGGTPIQISGVTGSVIMKQEPHESGGGTISLTPVSLSGSGQVSESILQSILCSAPESVKYLHSFRALPWTYAA